MICVHAVVAVFIGVCLPLPQDPRPGDMDCRCAFSTWIVSTCADADLPTITVSYGAGAHSGSCEGQADPCPQVNACGGKVNMHVIPKAFTGFTDHPGVFGVNMYGTFDFTNTVTNCGSTFFKDFDVWGNPAGNLLGRVTLWEFCTWCSDITGGD